MKIRTWIKYEEKYIPPKCRKPRYRAEEAFVNAILKEVALTDVKLAFEDNSYEGEGKIFAYKGKLYCKVKMPNSSILDDLKKRGYDINSPLDYLKYCNSNCSFYFVSAFDREIHGADTSKKAVMKKLRSEMQSYLLIDGELYIKCAEPRYCVNTFGLGHNHGGTGMFCSYYYNPNIPKSNYFSAMQGEEAVAYANKIAQRRGDTDDVGRFKPFIICHMPELVKVNPNKQHGNGNSLLNSVEEAIESTDNVMEAGLLTMALCAK